MVLQCLKEHLLTFNSLCYTLQPTSIFLSVLIISMSQQVVIDNNEVEPLEVATSQSALTHTSIISFDRPGIWKASIHEGPALKLPSEFRDLVVSGPFYVEFLAIGDLDGPEATLKNHLSFRVALADLVKFSDTVTLKSARISIELSDEPFLVLSDSEVST